MSWRDHVKVHPAASLFPMMSDDELKVLGEDIKRHGLTDYICFWSPSKIDFEKGQSLNSENCYLLDGRNRLEAMERAGLDINFDGYKGLIKRFFCGDGDKYSDPYAYVISANLHRRHLTAEDKRLLIGNLLKADPGKSNRYIAGLLGVDHKTVGAVRAELKSTGEIPQLRTTVGKDGKSRKQPSRKPERPHPAAALVPDQAACGGAAVARATMTAPAEAVSLVAPAQSAEDRKVHYAATDESDRSACAAVETPYDEDWPDLPPPCMGERRKLSDEQVMANCLDMLKHEIEFGILQSRKLGRLPELFLVLRRYIDRMELNAIHVPHQSVRYRHLASFPA
jgi:hypothetical protein